MPEEALKAAGRAELVTVEFQGEEKGSLRFSCWTNPDVRYSVVYDPNQPGGFCKHCFAALAHFAPWILVVETGASEALIELARLRKQKQRWEKQEEERWEKSL